MLKHTTLLPILLGVSILSLNSHADTPSISIDLPSYCAGKTDNKDSTKAQFEACGEMLETALTDTQNMIQIIPSWKPEDRDKLPLPATCEGLTGSKKTLTEKMEECKRNIEKQQYTVTIVLKGLTADTVLTAETTTQQTVASKQITTKGLTSCKKLTTLENINACLAEMNEELLKPDTSSEEIDTLRDDIDRVTEMAQAKLLETCLAPIDTNKLVKGITTKGKWADGKDGLEKEFIIHVDACVSVHDTAKAQNKSSNLEKSEKQLVALRDSMEAVSNRIATHFALDNSKSITSANVLELKEIEDKVSDKVNKALEFEPIDYVLPPWREEAFSFQFYAGLEASKLSDIMEQTGSRIGFQGYHRLTRKIEKVRAFTGQKCEVSSPCHDWTLGLHIFGNMTLVNVNENTFVTPKPLETDTTNGGDFVNIGDNMLNSNINVSQMADEETPPPNDPQEVDQALMTELGIFNPWYVSIRGDVKDDDYQEFMVGPIITAGLTINDGEQDNFRHRYYWGFRYAHNEETYLDILHGKNEGISGDRMEVRGQLPVTEFGGGRLFLGGRANFGIDEHKDENNDAWQIYMQWQTSFDELWKRSDKK